MDHAEIRTDELTAQGAVLVVRVPADCREELSGIRSYVADSLAMGVLVLEERMSFRVERFPPLGGVTVVRAEQAAPEPPELPPDPAPKRSAAAEKAAVLSRLKSYREANGLGCLDQVARQCGGKITADVLRDLLNGQYKLDIGDWRLIDRALAVVKAREVAANGEGN